MATYLGLWTGPGEGFLAAYRRLGKEPFRAALYGPAKATHAAVETMEAA